MSDTMASPTDWFQFYRRSLTGEDQSPTPPSSAIYGHHQFSDATVVTSVSTPTTGNSASLSPVSAHLNPEGRVVKPSRRRSRASRRTPTTLLNTDTTNFRAMVQQFTGVPSAPFATGPQTAPTSFNFGLGNGQHNLNAATVMAPSGYHLQHQQQQPYMFSMNNNTTTTNNNSANDLFLLRFSNGNQRSNMEVSASDGFLMDGIFNPRAS